ncbi:DNA mismatch repair protein MutS [Candidatus Cetobacterium colombiensis]|uniref:DNA mismatch repair protein MutS n=1 Tax=Candidatus Cetobacterium colombiensis TaxID=3073100 RepID=A0ABU4WCQ1_9FUSO|nr:DNA mismatch repair protein MutS [Candidatus Cetobacterium colombiensis]MDX8336351.1 DNA mismatch repair protein MutS [Candidatus Cetobacterium colombiensis]
MSADTPLMAQYKEIKKENQENILFFRLGDFYEMFFEDAVIVSKELGLTLTSRNKEKGIEVPLAGIPYHSSSGYIGKLVAKGYKVAICEQVEDPKTTKGIVKREVVRVITPGTIIDTEYLDEKSNNYLMGIVIKKDLIGLTYIDITTGEFVANEKKKTDDYIYRLLGEINKISPREVLIDENSYPVLEKELKQFAQLNRININSCLKVRKSEEFLKNYFKVISLDSFDLNGKALATEAAAMVLDYVLDLQKGNEIPVDKIIYSGSEEVMELNLTTQRNLDIVASNKENGVLGTLQWVLDSCKSSMGSRLLKHFLKNPSTSKEVILDRQKDIQFFYENVLLREEVREKLKEIYDIERIIGKLVLGNENARDLVALKKSIYNSLEVYKILSGNPIFEISLNELVEIFNLIEESIKDEVPFSIREGGLIKSGYNSELDELHNISNNGKDTILEIENREREKTGIKGLKIKYNKVFGYFIEITKANIHLVPDYYIRKQTLANAERYIVEDLKIYEEKVLNAKDKIENLEYILFKEISEKIKNYKNILHELAYKLAYLDVVANLAHIATKNGYIKPEITTDGDIEIIGGRHPIVEQLVGKEKFIKNSIVLNSEKNLIILTGPNMSGKSTYMKQVALILIMAHMGCYVPAEYAKIGIVDKIFTRIGASDDLVTGQSTFMLEMSEVANIVNSSTKDSFIILDEIGRGTSTFDGISIATAITEYIHDNIKAKTIFATHYHELTQLESKLNKSTNFRIEVKEDEKEIVFLREIVKGGADKSYGIEVARLAGLPKEILERAKEMLKVLEERKMIIEKKVKKEQLILFGDFEPEIKEEPVKKIEENIVQLENEERIALRLLKEIELDKMTPMDAFLKLNELKRILN